MTITPNLVFPGLDFRLVPQPPPAAPAVEPPTPYKAADDKWFADRADFREMLFARTYARPAIGQFAVTDLSDDVCRWPVSDAPYRFCGCLVIGAAPYCYGHQRLAYR